MYILHINTSAMYNISDRSRANTLSKIYRADRVPPEEYNDAHVTFFVLKPI